MRSSYSVRLARLIGLHARPARIDFPGGVASFTFDDFPKSALHVGGAILERHRARGTYYTAMELAGTENHFGPLFEPADVVAAHKAGHEIACHTRTHLDCRYAKPAEIAAEIDENGRQIAALLDGAGPTNFAYPYGAVSLTARHTLKSRFSSCRGTELGINAGATDLADLKVAILFNDAFDDAAMRRTIDEAASGNGWVIFYTHDVREQPSEWGCTPDQLEAAVGYAAEKLKVLPVRDVIGRIAGSA